MILAITSILTAIGNIFLGVLVLFKNKKSSINRYFFAFTLLLAAYILTSYVSVYLENPAIFKSTFIISVFLKTTGLLWIMSLCASYNKNIAIIAYLVAFAITCSLLIEGFMISNIKYNNQFFDYETEKGLFVSIIHNLVILLYGSFLLIKTISTQKGIVRKKLSLITVGLLGFAFAAFITSVALPSLKINNLSFLDIPLSLIFISFSAYAMIKYKSKD